MSRKGCVILIGISLSLMVFLTGCGSSACLSLKFAPNESTAYKATTEVIKDFRFEQPSADKLRQEQTKTRIEMSFTQKINGVDPEGTATATITIEELKVDIINKNEPTFTFNSQDEKDKTAPLAKLLGQSYTIELTPTGQVTVLDAKAALSSVPSSYEKKLVKSILNDKAIAQRHQVPALPQEKASGFSVESTWNQIVPSPPGLLAPKSYEKIYTLSDIDNDIVTIQMVANESGEPVKDGGGQAAGGMGMFAKMFDNEDDYTGTLKLNIATGKVLLSQETLVSSYLAEEIPKDADPAKGPDVLTMRFTNRVQLEKLN
jgi:hypothetical protein